MYASFGSTRAKRLTAIAAAFSGVVACGEASGGESGAADAGNGRPMSEEAPRYRTVEVVLESWELHDASINVEPPLGNLELQIG